MPEPAYITPYQVGGGTNRAHGGVGRANSYERKLYSFPCVADCLETLLLERRRARQQLVQEHAQRVQVAARVHVAGAQSGMDSRQVVARSASKRATTWRLSMPD